MQRQTLCTISLAITFLALIVVTLGAYVRLSNAGLGCPDWPGCYGQITPPQTSEGLENYQRPLEKTKAFKEMLHRYVAGLLGLAILLLAVLAVKNKTTLQQSANIPIALVFLVIFQALLGMWTVMLLLHPGIVMLHLLGGLTTLGLLWFYTIKLSFKAETKTPLPIKAIIGLMILIIQIALGGWVSANYAALACLDLPTCQGSWWPAMNFNDGFYLFRKIGIDYEGGILDMPARMAIHVTHRIGAVITFVYLMALALQTLSQKANKQLVNASIILITSLILQIGLGLLNVLEMFPLPLALMHHSGAVLLLMSMIYYIKCLTLEI